MNTTQHDADWALLVDQFDALRRTAERLGSTATLSLHSVSRGLFDLAINVDERASHQSDPDAGSYIGDGDRHAPFWTKRLAYESDPTGKPGGSYLAIFCDEPPARPTHPEFHDDEPDVEHCYVCWRDAHAEKHEAAA